MTGYGFQIIGTGRIPTSVFSFNQRVQGTRRRIDAVINVTDNLKIALDPTVYNNTKALGKYGTDTTAAVDVWYEGFEGLIKDQFGNYRLP